MKIVVTKSAKKRYFEIIENLLFYWNVSIAEDFIDLTEHLFEILESNPYCFAKYQKIRLIIKLQFIKMFPFFIK